MKDEFVTVCEERLKKCFLLLNYPINLINECVVSEMKSLSQIVKKELQADFDYYLEYQQVLQNEHGVEILKLMEQKPCKFFDALKLYSMGARAL